jgi:hypothetical protein
VQATLFQAGPAVRTGNGTALVRKCRRRDVSGQRIEEEGRKSENEVRRRRLSNRNRWMLASKAVQGLPTSRHRRSELARKTHSARIKREGEYERPEENGLKNGSTLREGAVKMRILTSEG